MRIVRRRKYAYIPAHDHHITQFCSDTCPWYIYYNTRGIPIVTESTPAPDGSSPPASVPEPPIPEWGDLGDEAFDPGELRVGPGDLTIMPEQPAYLKSALDALKAICDDPKQTAGLRVDAASQLISYHSTQTTHALSRYRLMIDEKRPKP